MSCIEENVLKCVSEILKMPVDLNTSVKNTPQWDSLRMVQIVMALDENGIGIPLEKLGKVESVRDLAAIAFTEVE